MSVDFVISTPWKKMNRDEAKSGYEEMRKFISEHSPTSRITQVIKVKSQTQAEHFGWYVRDVFRLYTILLESMAHCRQWSVFKAHDTYHTEGNNTVVRLTDAGREWDINAMYFDPVVGRVQFKWEDNTMALTRWKPWNWQIPILAEDEDDAHYFFDPVSKQAIVHCGSNVLEGANFDILLFGFKVDLPEDLNFFQVVK
jgi:hypothetical protein